MFWAVLVAILRFEFTTYDISLFLAGCVGTFLARPVINRIWQQDRRPPREPRAHEAVLGAHAYPIVPDTATNATNAPYRECVLHAWKQMAIKLLWITRLVFNKSRVVAALGRDVYLRVFQRAKQQLTNQTTDQTDEEHRELYGEAFGKKLTPAAGVPMTDPDKCDHADINIYMGSNKRPDGRGAAWWTCRECKTRWERLKLAHLKDTATPKPSDIVVFGKHKGKTYHDILSEKPNYAEWVVSTVEKKMESSPVIVHLATYLRPFLRGHNLFRPITGSDYETGDTMHPHGWSEDKDLL